MKRNNFLSFWENALAMQWSDILKTRFPFCNKLGFILVYCRYTELTIMLWAYVVCLSQKWARKMRCTTLLCGELRPVATFYKRAQCRQQIPHYASGEHHAQFVDFGSTASVHAKHHCRARYSLASTWARALTSTNRISEVWKEFDPKYACFFTLLPQHAS